MLEKGKSNRNHRDIWNTISSTIIKSTVLKSKDGSQEPKDSLELHVHAGW